MDKGSKGRESMIEISENTIYKGRFYFGDGNCASFAWPYTSIKVRFKGQRAAAVLESNNDDYFVVLVDGEVYRNKLKVNRRKLYMLAENLEDSEHTLEIIKRTECFEGTTNFYGFELFEGEALEPIEEDKLKLEVIGDSISCGFCNEAENTNVEFDAELSNSYLSYGALASRMVDADLNITAWSGMGLVNNSDNSPMPMPERIDWIVPEKVNVKWDFNKYIPDVVVVNLGTNDFLSGMINKERFINGYKDFIEKLLSLYGDVKIICCVGPMITGNELKEITTWIQEEVVEYYNNKKNTNIYYLQFDEQKAEDGYATANHPSIKTHTRMAEKLAGKISEIVK